MAAASQVINNASTKIEFAPVDNRSGVPTELLELKGANSASLSYGDTKVDLSTFGDRLIMPEAKVGVKSEASIGGIVVPGPAQEAWEKLGGDALGEATKEAYVKITRGDGSTRMFYALVGSYSEQLDQRDVLRFTSSATVQGKIVKTAGELNPEPENRLTHTDGSTMTHTDGSILTYP